MTSFLNNNLSIDRDKLKYSIFYFPGTGGHMVAWLLALAHDYLLLPKALECFPLELRNNHKTIRDKQNIPVSGWSFHENVQPTNPYCKICFLHTSHLDGYRKLDNMHRIIELASKHVTCISILMSVNARTRSCFEKGTRPFRTYDKITTKSTKFEKSIFLLSVVSTSISNPYHCFLKPYIINSITSLKYFSADILDFSKILNQITPCNAVITDNEATSKLIFL